MPYLIKKISKIKNWFVSFNKLFMENKNSTSRDNYTKIKTLGRGAFGDVSLVKDRTTNQ